MRRDKEKIGRRVYVLLTNPGSQLLALASAAMAPERLSAEQMRGIMKEFEALKAAVH